MDPSRLYQKSAFSAPGDDQGFFNPERQTMLTQLSPKLETKIQKEPAYMQEDFQILMADRAALEILVKTIVSNKRLSWWIVKEWLDQNDCFLIPNAKKSPA